VVRIHSPRPTILPIFIAIRRLAVLTSLASFRNCAQNCAHPGLPALAPWHLAPSVPAGERSAEWWKNRYGLRGMPTCMGPYRRPIALSRYDGTYTTGMMLISRWCTLSDVASLGSIFLCGRFWFWRERPIPLKVRLRAVFPLLPQFDL